MEFRYCLHNIADYSEHLDNEQSLKLEEQVIIIKTIMINIGTDQYYHQVSLLSSYIAAGYIGTDDSVGAYLM